MVKRGAKGSRSTQRRRAKPSAKRDHIEQELRGRIVKGVYPAGTRMPLRTELKRQFRAGPVTVQRALDRLIAAGFVQTRGRGGTYVAEHPPHLFRYALVFPKSPGDPDWNRFWTALSNEAQAVERASSRRLVIYHGIEEHGESRDYQPLLDAVMSQRLAGLIFPGYPDFVDGTPLLTASGCPCVAVSSELRWPGMSAVSLDARGFIDKALDYFAARKRHRIAIISLPLFPEHHESYITAGIRDRGLVTRPYWTQRVLPSSPKGVQDCAHLLMHAGQSERPDGLLIADDNLVEPATAGLVAAGLRVPEELEVVGHCNFPWPTTTHLPVTRLGYDTHQVLVRCIESIDRQRAGEQEPTIGTIPAFFETEFRATPRSPSAPGEVG